MEKPAEGIEFPETAAELNDETYEVEETDMMEMNNSSRLKDSKWKKKKKKDLIMPLSPASWLGYELQGGTPLLLASKLGEQRGGRMI